MVSYVRTLPPTPSLIPSNPIPQTDMLFGAVPIIFLEGKGWTQVQASLPFLAVLVGTLIGAAINLVYSHLVFAPYLDRHGGVAPPEMRLPTMMIGGLIFPCGFYMLGWAGTVGQIFGLGFIGVAFLLIFQSGINCESVLLF